MSSNKGRLKALERKQPKAKEWTPINIQWIDSEAGEKMEPPKPGTLMLYWDQFDNIGTYRYDPNKPNGGQPAPKQAKHD